MPRRLSSLATARRKPSGRGASPAMGAGGQQLPASRGILALQFEPCGPLIGRRLQHHRIGALLAMEIHLHELSRPQRFAAQPEGDQRIVEGILYAPRVRLGGQPPRRRARQFAVAIVDAEFVYAPRILAAIGLHHAQRAQRLPRKAEAQPPRRRVFRRDGGPQNLPGDLVRRRLVFHAYVARRVRLRNRHEGEHGGPRRGLLLDHPVHSIVCEVRFQVAFFRPDAQCLAPRNSASRHASPWA